jgi:hypothetical protein
MLRRNEEIVMGDYKVDELIMDELKKEFNLKLLWGSSGDRVDEEDRNEKFEQVMNVM